MATRLSVYNGALRILSERKLGSLTEDRKPRRVLDGIWDDNFIRYVLQQGQWKFAKRTIQANYDSAVTSDFGYQYAAEKPSDWLRTVAIATDEFFRSPLIDYSDERGYWWSNYQTIYVQHTSDDSLYGGDLSAWPETFTQYAESQLAEKACMAITGNASKLQMVQRETKILLGDARSKDALDGPPSFPPMGSWARARLGGRSFKNTILTTT